MIHVAFKSCCVFWALDFSLYGFGQQVERSGTMHIEFLMFDINILGVL